MFNKAFRFIGEIVRIYRILPAGSAVRWSGLAVLRMSEILRTDSLGCVDFLLRRGIAFRSGGRKFAAENVDLGVVREIVGVHRYVAPQELPSARHILDLEANCGVFTLFALANAPAAEVCSVEVQRELAAPVRLNTELCGFGDRVIVKNEWAGIPADFIETLLKDDPQWKAFDTDHYIAEVEEGDFVKCDIEGAELGFITPDSKWLHEVRQVSLEYYGNWLAGEKLGEVLRGLGFDVKQRSHDGLGHLAGVRV